MPFFALAVSFFDMWQTTHLPAVLFVPSRMAADPELKVKEEPEDARVEEEEDDDDVPTMLLVSTTEGAIGAIEPFDICSTRPSSHNHPPNCQEFPEAHSVLEHGPAPLQVN